MCMHWVNNTFPIWKNEIKTIIVKIFNKNMVKHTIVSWPDLKQWLIDFIFDFMMMLRLSTNILKIIREIGQLITHSPIYCINGIG